MTERRSLVFNSWVATVSEMTCKNLQRERPSALSAPHCASFIWNSHSEPPTGPRPPLAQVSFETRQQAVDPPPAQVSFESRTVSRPQSFDPTAQVSSALCKIHVMLTNGSKEMEADHRRVALKLGREMHGTQLRLSQLARKQNCEDIPARTALLT